MTEQPPSKTFTEIGKDNDAKFKMAYESIGIKGGEYIIDMDLTIDKKT